MNGFRSVKWSPTRRAGVGEDDLNKLGDALNEVSRRAAAQWLAFLSLWAYLFFTTVAVTDYDLLVLPAIKLPLIGIELGLFQFFVWAPVLFWVMQLYLSRKVALVAETVIHYLEQVKKSEPTPSRLAMRRHRFDAFAVTGLLGRFDAIGGPAPGAFLRVLTWLTVVVTLFMLPVALYVAFELRFIAYQHETMTWYHRGMLVVGSGLALFTIHRAGVFSGCWREITFSTTMAATIAGVGLTITAITFPGEWLDDEELEHDERFAFTYLTPKPPEAQSAKLIEAGKSEDAYTVNLAGRDFTGRHLREANFSGANLAGAVFRGKDFFSRAELRGANFSEAKLQGADLRGADLQNAAFYSAWLRGTDLSRANLQATKFSNAQLQGATFNNALLEGCSLVNARLEAADMSEVSLLGADLTGAHLQGGEFLKASFRATFLSEAHFWRNTISYFMLGEISLMRLGLYRDLTFHHPPLTPDELSLAIPGWLSSIPAGEKRNNAQKRFEILSAHGDPFSDIAGAAEINFELKKSHNESSYVGRTKEIINAYCFGLLSDDALIEIIHRSSSFFEWKEIISANMIIDGLSSSDCLSGKNMSIKLWRALRNVANTENKRLLEQEADSWMNQAFRP